MQSRHRMPSHATHGDQEAERLHSSPKRELKKHFATGTRVTALLDGTAGTKANEAAPPNTEAISSKSGRT